MNRLPLILTALTGALVVGGCSWTPSDSTPSASSSASSLASGAPSASRDRFPSVVTVSPTRSADGSWTFDVTMTSPYDSADRYADGWRVAGQEWRHRLRRDDPRA